MAGNISSKMRGKEESLGDDPKKTAGAWEETVGVLIRCSQFSQGSRWRGHSSEQRGREENSWRRMKAMEKAAA